MTDAPIHPRPRPRPLRDFAGALGFLTLLPFGRMWEGEPPRSVGWYPWVGWVLGMVVALPLWLAQLAGATLDGIRALLVASLVVAAWALLTRFLHWDGLADTFDGIWGGATRERRLEIMRDSRIGSFGAAAMLMTALVQVAAVAAVVAGGAWWALVAAPVVARFAAANAAWTLPPARREGLGLTAMDEPGAYDIIVAVLAVAALAKFAVLAPTGAVFGALPSTGAIAPALVTCTAGLLAAFVVPRTLSRSVGGMTGDLFGATVLIVETLVLVVAAFLA
jgi:adenosylcobinamide-GDP ribazoletransferase